MKPLPSYWTYDRFLKKLGNGKLKEIMSQQVKRLYDLGVVDASFIGLGSTPVVANTKQNNPKTFAADKFKPENQPKADPDCALSVHSAFNQHNERRYEFYWGYKNHVLVDYISGPPLYELTTHANAADSTVVEEILAAANSTLSIQESTFLGDKGYDVKTVYALAKDIYDGEAVISLNKRNTKNPDQLPAGRLLCSAGLAMHKDGKTFDNGGVRQKFCRPLRTSKSGHCPCDHKNWNNGKRRRGCTKYLTLPSDYQLSIDRECLQFKRTYALRTECERYNFRFKASGQERPWIRKYQQRRQFEYARSYFRFDCCSGRCPFRLSFLPLCQTSSTFHLTDTRILLCLPDFPPAATSDAVLRMRTFQRHALRKGF